MECLFKNRLGLVLRYFLFYTRNELVFSHLIHLSWL